MPPQPIQMPFCTTTEAAVILGVSVATVQVWVERGLLQAWKTSGGHRRILRDSVNSMIYKAASGRTTQSAAEEATARLRVLVIDDDASLLRLYSQQIRRWPMQPDVTVMDNAIAALLAIGRTPPDLLIADLHMPGVDGFSVLRILQRTPELADVKLVAVSGMAAADIADRGGIAPGIELLPKPIPFARLQEIAGTLQPVRRQPLCNPHESTPP